MTRLYPGMIDHSKEYFTHEDEVMLIADGQVRHFDEVPEHPELARIIETEDDLREVLTYWFGDDPRRQQKQLAKCRFGGLNFTPDINAGETASDYRECPLRGRCSGEGIVCQSPTINGQKVSQQDIQILKEICGNDKNSTIADRMGFPLGTFKVAKTALYKKCRFVTKQQAAFALFFEGLL